MMRAKTLIGVAAGAAVAVLVGAHLLGLGWPGLSAPATGATPQPAANAGLPVPVVAVVRQTVPVYRDYVAAPEAIRSVTLQAKVTGYLQEQAAADGADVKPGDLLYRIDPRDYQAILDHATAQAQRDAAALDYARANQKRNSQLSQQGWVTKDSSDQVTS